MKESTLQDVATLAGVSTGTVSKFINGKPISPKNRVKVEGAIDLLHYTPNPLARNFAIGRSYTILLFILAEYPIVDSTWLHELPIIHGINEVLHGTGYSLKIEIASVQSTAENSQRLEAYTRNKNIDGLVMLSPWDVSDRLLIPLDYREFPYVLVGGGNSERRSGAIDFDNQAPIYEIVRSMYEHGHRRFALVGGFREQRHMKKREAGFRNALSDLGLPVDERLLCYGDFSPESGYELTTALLSQPEPPTAIVCGNDYIASGAIRAIKERGLRVPADITVSGFDNTVVSFATDPTITSVHVPSFEMGVLSMQELLKKLEDKDYVIQNRTIRCEVVKKQSTATPVNPTIVQS